MASAEVRVELDLRIPMRDGVVLYGVLYRPIRGDRHPTLLVRSPYDTQNPTYMEWALRFAENGYAVVLQDVRGRYESEGRFEPYVHEIEDGFDTHQWIGQQPWCDGTIGTFGVSYPGFTQILPATLRSPYLKALVPTANQEDNYGHLRYNGLLQLENAMNFLWLGNRNLQMEGTKPLDMGEIHRRLPLISALDDVGDRPFYRDVVSHPTFDGFWKSYSMKERYGDVDVPALFVTGWYDNLVHEGFKCFAGWRAHARSEETRRLTKLVVGPWTHMLIGGSDAGGDISFGSNAVVDIPDLHLRWYDRRLRGIDTGIDEEPPVRIFVMGDNAWRSEDEWPLGRTEWTRFYLRSGGRANSFHGDGTLDPEAPESEPSDSYRYDPMNPVPTSGGQSMKLNLTGPRDRRPIQRRDDVLVYTTEPLAEDLEVTGPIELTLYAASSAPDTDFTGTLVDVHPDGRAIHITEGIVRARYRDSYEAPTPIEAGEVYEYRFQLWETSNVFKAGHRVRLEVSSSNFPRFDRNQNTGTLEGMDDEVRIADQVVRHSAEHPSHLTLPVIPPA